MCSSHKLSSDQEYLLYRLRQELQASLEHLVASHKQTAGARGWIRELIASPSKKAHPLKGSVVVLFVEHPAYELSGKSGFEVSNASIQFVPVWKDAPVQQGDAGTYLKFVLPSNKIITLNLSTLEYNNFSELSDAVTEAFLEEFVASSRPKLLEGLQELERHISGGPLTSPVAAAEEETLKQPAVLTQVVCPSCGNSRMLAFTRKEKEWTCHGCGRGARGSIISDKVEVVWADKDARLEVNIADVAAAREVLGVGPQTTNEMLKTAYRRAAKQWHPDRHAMHDNETREAAAQKMMDINQAYSLLSGLSESHR